MIDLHVHSTSSDGTLSPEELAAEGRGFSLMALTDHDNCEGCGRFLDESSKLGVRGLRLAGIELSVDPGPRFRKFHMLGLGIDPRSSALAAFLAEVKAGRETRNAQMLSKLNELGVHVTLDDVMCFVEGPVAARPHMARMLVEKGFAKDVGDVFARYLGDGAPAYVARFRPSPERAIDVIHSSGGLAVMAHPGYCTLDIDVLREELWRLKDVGLDGMEAWYQANSLDKTIEHLRIARELNMLATAGSDFHGANKPTVTLGMDVGEAEEKAMIEGISDRLSAISRMAKIA